MTLPRAWGIRKHFPSMIEAGERRLLAQVSNVAVKYVQEDGDVGVIGSGVGVLPEGVSS